MNNEILKEQEQNIEDVGEQDVEKCYVCEYEPSGPYLPFDNNGVICDGCVREILIQLTAQMYNLQRDVDRKSVV